MSYLLRFFIGGLVVSIFAALGGALKPKRFAGIFSAVPSVALGSLGLTILADGKIYAAQECRSMLVGAVAFLFYSVLCTRLMLTGRFHAAPVTIGALVVWLAASFGAWALFLR
jgi:Protein of unknown function (DUF3147)